MVRIATTSALSALLFVTSTSTSSAFVVGSNTRSFVSTRPTSAFDTTPETVVEAAPTMVIYWSIKTAIDTVSYALGNTDEVKGTGVFSGFELKRDTSEKDEDESKKDDTDKKGGDKK